jgi:hypothetical protein
MGVGAAIVLTRYWIVVCVEPGTQFDRLTTNDLGVDARITLLEALSIHPQLRFELASTILSSPYLTDALTIPDSILTSREVGIRHGIIGMRQGNRNTVPLMRVARDLIFRVVERSLGTRQNTCDDEGSRRNQILSPILDNPSSTDRTQVDSELLHTRHPK